MSEKNKKIISKEIEEKENSKNIIIGNIQIEENHLTERIINSYENVKNENPYDIDDESKENEKEIKNCDIYINNQKINFTYFYDFPKTGNYMVIYKFKNLLKVTNYLFYNCYTLTSLNLSNFNTQNVTNMRYMFYNCKSLTSLDLSNFNTQNVTNMEYMFSYCYLLTS